jgi:DNA repair protein RecN (Recombination protein N)
MLKHLYIKNYALIEELDMDFQEGFSVITGETGAGKSILLGAIGLLMGQRADSKSIQTGASRCVIEAEFYLEGFGLETFFSENDFDFEGHICTLRRELTSAGKSRAFINDTPATVAQLKELGSHIIDIHSQH